MSRITDSNLGLKLLALALALVIYYAIKSDSPRNTLIRNDRPTQRP